MLNFIQLVTAMLELRHLRSLIAIAETGRINAAAEAVHLTPSALSHQLRALEDHYGMPLLLRDVRGLRFTPAGERLLALARQMREAQQAAEQDLQRIQGDTRGTLRVVLECHTCFEWLMPVLDAFRQRWPDVEVDLVSGFHRDPLTLLSKDKADVVIGALRPPGRQWASLPLFRFEILLALPPGHALCAKRSVRAVDLQGETLITYPAPDERIDLIREVLQPAGISLPRRTAELTIAILQLVASRRGVAALPNWALKPSLDSGYVQARRIGPRGLWSELHATVPRDLAQRPYVRDLVEMARQSVATHLDGVQLL
ncbi:HTH-type transcriptional regulator MetR [Thiomonas arsenitoxydans]|uniref:HTH-type transcriptional regulator MetR n=2 Tax=Thiomonas arsenitoxydans (strain DSM 22701 / CIP 110005 / 3As) TaxID=426114 RepID=A0ABM9T856_THIA3|nr:HTH-type transcriptional regulator MetR [Thiomonas arsenitoxydans]CQR38197.1 HTH-type transcriptional regulator MetR [Thiomonas arsenitoxydans]CQR40411.1 HTH-type transcriptional regulator MetR [Thiomonas arsenitoxydans]CQR40480.1 HTH-type transcriptional regulator MetR [Thiomonas arsenitoxydans]